MSQKFYTLITQQGAILLANATALGNPLKLSKMAVGDANGKATTPNASQTKLIHEVYKAPINTLTTDEKNPNQIIAELVIPENQGGWFINEIGLYDENDTLVAVGNCPATYKPQLSEGSGRTQIIRMIIVVDNINAVALKIDPSVVLATRQYVDDLITSKMTAHEKSTNHPNATTKSEGFVQLNSAIDSNLENQAATPLAVKKVNDNVIFAHDRISQVHDYSKEINNKVVLANNRITDVHQYAKSINNDVIFAHNKIGQVHDYSKEVDSRVYNVNDRVNIITDKFVPVSNETRVYSADKRVYMLIRNDGVMGMYSNVKKGFAWQVNHDGWMDGYMSADRIGGLDQFVRDRSLPVGIPQPWPNVQIPTGWLECNGSVFNKNQYTKLAKAYPSGKLPDLRGVFIRGKDNGRGLDPNRNILSYQDDAIRNIWGRFPAVTRCSNPEPIEAEGVFSSESRWNPAVKTGNPDNWGQVYSFNASRVVPVANENRPRNIAFMYIVKAE